MSDIACTAIIRHAREIIGDATAWKWGRSRFCKPRTVSAPKMAGVVRAHNFFRRNGAKPILQVTVPSTG
jgi:hypothetical protein